MEGQRPRSTRAPQLRGAFTIVLLLAAAAASHVLLGWKHIEWQRGRSPAVGHPSRASKRVREFDGVILTSYHKIGTGYASCILDSMAWHLGMLHGRNISSITLEDNVTSSAVSYYLDLARAGAMKSMQAEFISTPAAQPQMPRRPFLLISVDDMPAEEICFDTAVRYFDTQLRWHSGEAPGKVCPNECPCYDGRTDCMDIGSCYANSPHDSLFWVLVIQNPVEAILTSYHNHMACLEPEPHEQWMQEITAAEYARILKSRGVKPHILSHLKMTNADNTSAWQHLQQLPEHDGLLLEFLHMSTSLWKMARMHKQARRLKATSLVIKQEDLEEDPLPVLSCMAAVTGLADQNDMLLAQYVDQKCSPLKTRRHRKHHQGQKKSAPPGNKSHIHLPAAEMAMADEAAPNVQGPKEKRERRERRENLLMGHGDVFDALCRLEQLLGYTDKTNSACVRRRLLKDE